MSQTKVGNQNTNNGTRLVKLPLRVNPETIEANEQVGKVRYVRIGSKHYDVKIIRHMCKTHLHGIRI